MGRRVLTVLEQRGCPVFAEGDRMVLDLPGVDVEASSAVCGLALAKLLAPRATDCPPPEPLEAVTYFECPRASDPVRFRVEVSGPPLPAPEDAEATTDLTSVASRLGRVPVFRGLPEGFLVGLAAQLHVERYPTGAAVVERGRPGDRFFVIDEGRASVFGHGGGELHAVVRELGPRDCFGEMSLLTGAPAMATVKAAGPLTVLAMEAQTFDAMLSDYPFMASRFAKLVAARLLAANFLLAREGNLPFRGKLSVMGISTVLQVLAESRRTCRLRIRSTEGETAWVIYRDGKLVDAGCGGYRGPSAVYALIRWEDGDFWLDPDPPTDLGEDTEDLGLMSLLLEGMRRLDEGMQP